MAKSSLLLHFLIHFLCYLAFQVSADNQYKVQGVSHYYRKGVRGLYASVKYQGSDTYYQKPTSPIIKDLNVTVMYENDYEFSVKISDSLNTRYSIPSISPYPYTKEYGTTSAQDYKVDLNEGPFAFKVSRISTSETVFDTSNSDFMFSDLFLTIGTTLPSKYIYGLGERTRDFLYESGVYTIWNKGQNMQTDNGKGGQQTSGSHPMYLMREASGKWHVVFLKSSNAMDVDFDASKKTLKYIVTGGELEFKFFLGDEYPETAIRRYHNYINGWTLHPFWAHGYHQCRWGYLYLQDLIDVYNNMTYNQLPMDAIWTDIDVLYNFTNFIIDDNRFNLQEFRDLTKYVRWVSIVEPTVPLNKTTPAYELGQKLDIWIRSSENHSEPLIGSSWPGLVYWPDWFHPNASSYLKQMLSLLYSQVPFSGIWLDMNEVTNFCDGEYPHDCYFYPNYLPSTPNPSPYNQKSPISLNPEPLFAFSNAKSSLNSADLPYIPGKSPLENQTLSLDALHHNGITDFNLHNLNGFMETVLAYQSFQSATSSTPFVVTRSTFPGSGRFAAHWTGDNEATWRYMELSLPEIFNFQLFGIPMTGADICGYHGNVTEELCARWMQLGALYPFMRNQGDINSTRHEPYLLGPTVLVTSQMAIQQRYSMLKYYYSLFVKNQGFGTIFRPVFFEFPQDETLLSNQNQFMIGSDVMGVGLFKEGVEEVSVYFPGKTKWYDYYSGQVYLNENEESKNVSVLALLNQSLPLFMKGGSIVYINGVDGVLNTSMLDGNYTLLVALLSTENKNYHASGQMLGVSEYSEASIQGKCYGDQNNCFVNISVIARAADNGTIIANITFSPNAEHSVLENIYLANVMFYGVVPESCQGGESYCDGSAYTVLCQNDEPVLIQYGKIQTYNFDNLDCAWLPTA